MSRNDLYGFLFSYRFKNKHNPIGYDTHYSLLATPKTGLNFLKTCRCVNTFECDDDTGHLYSRSAGEGVSFRKAHSIMCELLGIGQVLLPGFDLFIRGRYAVGSIISSILRYDCILNTGWHETYDKKLVGCFRFMENKLKLFISKNAISVNDMFILKMMTMPSYYLKIFSDIQKDGICVQYDDLKTILLEVIHCNSFNELRMKELIRGIDNLDMIVQVFGLFQQCGTHEKDFLTQKCERFYYESQK